MIGRTSNSNAGNSRAGRLSGFWRRWSLGHDFDRFWAAAAASNLGDGIRNGALPLLAITLTDDARLIGLISAVALLPWLVFGPVGGALVDRVDRRRLMIGGQLGRAALALILVGLVSTGTITVWALMVLAFGLGVGEILVDASSQAAIPQLVEVEELDRANGRLIAAVTLLDQVAGVAIGAALFAVAAGLPFAVDGVTFLLGAALLVPIRRPLQGSRSAPASVRSDIAAGMRFLLRHRLLRGVMVAVTLSNLGGNLSFAVLVILLVDELGASEATFGIVLGLGAVGGVIGSLVAARLADRFGRRRLLAALPVALAASYLVNAVARSPWVVAGSFFVASFAIVTFNVPGQSIRQTVTPEHLLGRVVTSFRTIALGAAPVGAVLGGFITAATDVRAANLAAAAVMVVAGGAMVAALRHLDESAPPRSGAGGADR